MCSLIASLFGVIFLRKAFLVEGVYSDSFQDITKGIDLQELLSEDLA